MGFIDCFLMNMTRDVIAPTYGKYRIKDFYNELMERDIFKDNTG